MRIGNHVVLGMCIVKMAKGIRELYIEQLVEAGFPRAEAHSMVANWANVLFPEHQGLLADLAHGLKHDVDAGMARTYETTRAAFQRMREAYQDHRFVYFF